MTCREFKHTAASLTLWELACSQEAAIAAHAEACSRCGVWLQQQRSLAASMQTLRTSTSGREAGPSVEQALLRAFRQVPRPAAPAPAAVKEHVKPLLPAAAPRSTPIALRLSRWFEMGAYAAVAAAIVVGIFLGIRLLHDRQITGTGQSPAARVRTVPVTPEPEAATGQLPMRVARLQTGQKPVQAARHKVLRESQPAASVAGATAVRGTSDDSQTTAELGYVPLMFCDPLSCSSDTQVVRMELPQGQNAPPQVADVVVGYDGTVRAVRMVNY